MTAADIVEKMLSHIRETSKNDGNVSAAWAEGAIETLADELTSLRAELAAMRERVEKRDSDFKKVLDVAQQRYMQLNAIHRTSTSNEEVARLVRECVDSWGDVPEMPQWRDKPTCVGRWLCEGRIIGIVEYEFDEFLFNDALQHGCDENSRWFGPIPTDPSKESGE